VGGRARELGVDRDNVRGENGQDDAVGHADEPGNLNADHEAQGDE